MSFGWDHLFYWEFKDGIDGDVVGASMFVAWDRGTFNQDFEGVCRAEYVVRSCLVPAVLGLKGGNVLR